jgi:hypothetical protein
MHDAEGGGGRRKGRRKVARKCLWKIFTFRTVRKQGVLIRTTSCGREDIDWQTVQMVYVGLGRGSEV